MRFVGKKLISLGKKNSIIIACSANADTAPETVDGAGAGGAGGGGRAGWGGVRARAGRAERRVWGYIVGTSGSCPKSCGRFGVKNARAE